VIGKLVLFTFCALIFSTMISLAEVPQPTWVGVHSLMPKAMYWSGVCSYNGKVYVFGGNENDSETKTTYVYDIASDAWTQGADMPTGRYLCTAVEVDGKIYVMGGRQLTASTNPVNVNECYDPATNTWSTKAAMPNAIRGHAAAAASGKIYVMGGNTGAYTDAVSVYDTAANSWSAGTKVPAKVGYGGAAYSSSANTIFYVGGVKSSTDSASNFIGKVYAYSLTSNTWDAGTTMTYKTAYFGIAADATGAKIYIASGGFWDSSSAAVVSYPYVQVFNTATKTFGDDIVPPSPWNRQNGSAAFANGSLWLLEGDGNRMIDEYDPSADAWYEPNMPINDGRQYIYNTGSTGGAISGKFYIGDGGFYTPITGEVFAYDPSANEWALKNGVNPLPRMYVTGGVWNDKMVVYGGMDEAGNVVATATVYDSLADTFTAFPTANPHPTLFECGAVLNDKLYLFGGRTDPADAASLVNYTNILDLTSGTWSSGATLPVPLEQASAAAFNGKIYIFSGIDNVDPDFVYDKVLIYDPAGNSFTTGATFSQFTQEYSSYAVPYGDNILVDSGYNLYYNDLLGGLSGGMLAEMQVYNPATNSFTGSVYRPFGKMRFVDAFIGNSYYSTTGEDPDWAVTRLDIASFGGTPVCTVTCTASATPTSGQAPLAVAFTATATGSNCTGTPTFAWTFGDAATSTEQNPSHTYAADGTYNWAMTATIAGKTCSKSGTITVGGVPTCTVTCSASGTPTSGTSPLNVAFTASATASNCTGTPAYAWTFGDAGTSTEQNPAHTYESEGTYNWTMTVTVDSQTCSKTGTITVANTPAPVISSVSKAGSPFRLIINGTGFASGCTVKIDGTAVATKFKSAVKVVAKNCKTLVPKGVAVKITVTNTDGGVSNEYSYTRP